MLRRYGREVADILFDETVVRDLKRWCGGGEWGLGGKAEEKGMKIYTGRKRNDLKVLSDFLAHTSRSSSPSHGP